MWNGSMNYNKKTNKIQTLGKWWQILHQEEEALVTSWSVGMVLRPAQEH